MKNSKKVISSHDNFFLLSDQYLKTSQLIIKEIIKSGNQRGIIVDYPLNIKDHIEATKWSDFNTLIPAFSLFYQGLELLLKGFVFFQGETIGKIHKYDDIIKKIIINNENNTLHELIKSYYYPEKENKIIKQVIKSNFIYLNSMNSIANGETNIMFRYPEDEGKLVVHNKLRYQKREIIPALEKISKDIDKIFILTREATSKNCGLLKVVAALIEKDNKILIAKRLEGKYENLWEFPGGKVDDSETEKQAIEREIAEEFNIVIEAKEFIKNNIYKYPDIIVDLRLYYCEYISGTIKLSDHKEYKWVDRKNILDYELAPADIKLAEYIKEM